MGDLKSRPRLQTAVFLVILGLAAYRFLHGSSAFYPLAFGDDESYYLAVGAHWRAGGRPDMGPLYSCFYALLHSFRSDPISLFYLNLAIQATLLPLLHFFLSRRMGVSPFFSFLGAFFVLISTANAPVLVKINHFNLSSLYGVLWIASLFPGRSAASGTAALLSIPLIFVRPDDALICAAFLTCWLAALWTAQRPKPVRAVQCLVALAAFASAWLAALRIGGSPFPPEHSWLTFVDHFLWSKPNFIVEEPRSSIVKFFPTATTIVQAARENPLAFWSHVGANLKAFPADFIASFAGHFPLLSRDPGRLAPASAAETVILLALLSAAFLTRPRRRIAEAGRSILKRPVVILACVMVLACGFKDLLETSLLHPWTRYYLDLLFGSMLLLLAALDLGREERRPALAIAAAATLALLCPRPRGPALYQEVEGINFSKPGTKQVVLFLRGLPRSPSSRWFGGVPYSHFLAENAPDEIFSGNVWSYLAEKESGGYANLFDYVKRGRYDLVIDDLYLRETIERREPRGSLDTFRAALGKAGFEKAFASEEADVYLRRPAAVGR